MRRLLHAAVAPGTHKTYATGWEAFSRFCQQQSSLVPGTPAVPADIRRFIAWLSLQAKAPATIATYVSAVGYAHKIRGWADPTQDFLVSKLLEGCRRDRPSTDARIPVTLSMLTRIVRALPNVCTSVYEAQLFKAAFLAAFFGFMRIGEFAADSKTRIQPSVIKAADIHFDEGLSVTISFPRSKNNQKGLSQVIRLQKAMDSHSTVCPVKALTTFAEARPASPDDCPFFRHFGGCPLTRYQVTAVLQKAISFARLNGERISSHSFRIGAASYAHDLGVSSNDIRAMGRWRSNAFSSYVRPIPSCTLPGVQSPNDE